jgi:hypothetical protein
MKHLIRALLYQKLLVDNKKALTLREPRERFFALLCEVP